MFQNPSHKEIDINEFKTTEYVSQKMGTNGFKAEHHIHHKGWAEMI
jgi:hypothetical protein